MGTKNNPGKHDCYDKAEDDEPMFVLLARDAMAPELVRKWAEEREMCHEDVSVTREARLCAAQMEVWRRERME